MFLVMQGVVDFCQCLYFKVIKRGVYGCQVDKGWTVMDCVNLAKV